MSWQSVMWEHTEHLQAIGMISIEVNNLESFLSDLLTEILEVDPKVGRAIYWKPQSAGLRMGIVKAAAEATFAVRFKEISDDPKIKKLEFEINNVQKSNLDKAISLVKRAEAVSLARHSVMHDIWGTDNSSGAVSRAKTHASTPHRIVPLHELHGLIDRMRKIIDDTRVFSKQLLKARTERRMAILNPQPAHPSKASKNP